MEAKDTVMNHEHMMAEIWDLGFGLEGAEGRSPTQTERFERLVNSQAEISFEAGMQEVVGFIEGCWETPPQMLGTLQVSRPRLSIAPSVWTNFLRERGLNEKRSIQ